MIIFITNYLIKINVNLIVIQYFHLHFLILNFMIYKFI
jgi:hypothetical protein